MRVRHGSNPHPRRGIVIVLSAVLLIVIFSMVAFAIDIGYMQVVEAQLQASADFAALAGAAKLVDDDELKGAPQQFEERYAARQEAILLASLNPAGGKVLNLPENSSNGISGDLVLGYVPDRSKPDVMLFNAPIYNAVKVRLRRDSIENDPVALFFSPIIGYSEAEMAVEAVAIFEMGIKGFQVVADDTFSALLPFTLHVDDWNEMFNSGNDDWHYDTFDEEVTEGADGIREVKLFPSVGGGGKGKSGVTPGNFGTIDIGAPNNSTSDLARQILEGPNEEDFSYFPNNTVELGEDGTLILNGDTGISAGMKDELESIIGQPRIIPLYESVSGNGNNSQFVIVKFVGITVLDVKLTGSQSSKHVTIQPTFVVDPTAKSGGENGVTSSFIRQPLSLIR